MYLIMRSSRLRTIGKSVLGLVLLFASFPYAAAPIYTITPPKPFHGSVWFNPYHDAKGSWHKANVHLHSRAWFGATDGRKNSLEAIDTTYRHLGYSILALSNYQRIDSIGRGWVFLPCYEHGYNVQKTHQLVVGARSVIWLDGILPQTIFVKQWILDVLRPTAEVLILAHPAFGRPSYSETDMAVLSNYEAIEVFNHYRTSRAHWDSALTNGIVAWSVGNDDCHDVSSQGETGVCLTLLNLPSRWTAHDVYHAYRTGKTIAVKTTHARLPLGVPRQHLVSDSLIVETDSPADSIHFVGNRGAILSRSVATSRASILLDTAYRYVRAEVYSNGTTYLLNPVICSDGSPPLQQRRLVEDRSLTALHRALWVLVYLNGLVLLYRRRGRQ